MISPYNPAVERDLDAIIDREGRAYTNDPDDPGGPTKFGITLATLQEEWGPRVTASDVEGLDERTARAIYRRRYIERPGFLGVTDDGLRSQLIDFGVHSGPVTAIRYLQAELGVTQDGILGRQTFAALEAREARGLGNALAVRRALFLARQVVTSPRKLRYLFGWLRRALSFVR